jgi:protein SCO1/2
MAVPAKSFYLLLALAVGLGAAAAYWRLEAANPRHTPIPELATGSYLAPRRELPDFSLIDTQGRSFGNANLRGQWSFMFFGYTNCPDFCPTTLTTLAAMERRLRAAHAAIRPRVIFVSVDAKRDTPAQMAKYVPYFDPEFVGLTAADQPAIEAVARKMNIPVSLRPRDDGGYTVDHSGAILVLDPQGRLTAVLTGPFDAAVLEADFKRIVAAGA